MELGALVCTAKHETCARCPIAAHCAWRLAGYPAHQGPPRRAQTYAGTDRQVRGRLLAVLREATGPVSQSALDAVWHEPVQRARALDTLVADGLVEPLDGGYYRLPHSLKLGVSECARYARNSGVTPWKTAVNLGCYTTDGSPCVGRRLLRTAP